MHINNTVYKIFILHDRTTYWLTVIAQLMWKDRAMRKTAKKRKLFDEKHDREKVFSDCHIFLPSLERHTHRYTNTPKCMMIIFSQFIIWKLGFA